LRHDRARSSAVAVPRHDLLSEYLAECRDRVLREIQTIIPDDGRYGEILYRLMLDYPLRAAKGLRPTLSIAACRALGGNIDDVLPSAAVFELFHNAFLIHDDVEDQSERRRGAPTLHRAHGVPVAINVGDAMLCLSLQPLLDNVERVGLGPALRILRLVARMTRESVEGQALELDWVRHGRWDLTDDDYVRMVEQKTGWYSFIAPLRAGAIAAGADNVHGDIFTEFGRRLSIAFQITDDVLSLEGDRDVFGKDTDGDLWEGKRTLVLLHMMRSATPRERRMASQILSRPRPASRRGPQEHDVVDRDTVVQDLVSRGELSRSGHRRLVRAGICTSKPARVKTRDDVRKLTLLIHKYKSLDYARSRAIQWASAARFSFDRDVAPRLVGSIHRDVLEAIVDYVYQRQR
jgi:geranylgeranyl diphosphate synthase type II